RDPKTKGEAARFLDKARELIKEREPSPWHVLQLLRLGTHTDDESYLSVKEVLPAQFKLRGEIEILQAKCDKAQSRLTPEVLVEIEKLDTKADGVPLALGWIVLTRHNARKGASRADSRAMFEQHMRTGAFQWDADL